ncbi:efflux RND transporter permease subunit [Candidatus Saccharibacteria bacterium]|nr:efflux RND transporter permease subunit [Candidatus Saccharibacteria bacterium]
MSDENDSQKEDRKGFWVSLSLACLRYWPLTLLVWLAVLAGSVYVYTQVITKDGFPSISTPVVLVSADYFSDDAETVDGEVAAPLGEIFEDVEDVVSVQLTSDSNGVNGIVSFGSDVESREGKDRIERALEEKQALLPDELEIRVNIIEAARYFGQYDLLLTVYDRTNQSGLKQIQEVADFTAEDLSGEAGLEAESIPVLVNDGQGQAERQIGFNQVGLPDGDNLNFYSAIHIGVANTSDDRDTIELSDLVEQKLDEIDLSSFEGEFEARIIEDFAIAVREDIGNLENNLLVGIMIISIISLLLISWRAAIVIGLFMISVLAITILGLHAVGYSLNIITLFALILSLGLIVDDAVIIVESLDVAKSKNRQLPLAKIVRTALDKILLASLSGTLTTVLVFVPLAFVAGILGDFIRLIPITVIVALLTSFLLSIILIPTLAKFSVLRERKSDVFKRFNPFLKLEDMLGKGIAQLPLMLKRRPRRGRITMTLILAFSLSFIMFSFFLGSRLGVNIFPPLRDSDVLGYSVEFPPGYDLATAEAVAEEINEVIISTLPGDVERVNYLAETIPNQRQMQSLIQLKPLEERSDRSPALVDKLQQALDESISEEVGIFVNQRDPGPPILQYPFTMPIIADDHEAAVRLAGEIETYLTGEEAPSIEQQGGEPASVKSVRVRPGADQIERLGRQRIINFEAQYDQATVSDTVISDTQALIEERFDADWLAAAGYEPDILEVEAPEDLFEQSFTSMMLMIPIALLIIYLLLWWQFKAWFQPVLILMALPFAMVGVLNWFYATGTPFSFFVFVGITSLIGIAVNNTILLVSYANFALRNGAGSHTEAIGQALKERFRPLVITTMTTALALLPLAINDFFWQDLAWTIIWGLISSTLLVLLIFPYLYIATNRLLARNKKHNKPRA